MDNNRMAKEDVMYHDELVKLGIRKGNTSAEEYRKKSHPKISVFNPNDFKKMGVN